MDHPDFEQAMRYALARMERELPPQRIYHNVAHTRDEVAPAAEHLATLEGIEGEALLLVRTAAWFHDIGFVVNGFDHESIGAWIAGEALPAFGYGPEQIATVQGMIQATRLPQSPSDLLEQILADADLDLLGCEEFIPRNEDLRTEMATYGQAMSDEEWYTSQIEFLQSHRYFTSAANALRTDGKARNIEWLNDQLARVRACA